MFPVTMITTEDLSPPARQMLHNTILLALRKGASSPVIMPMQEFRKRTGFPLRVTDKRLIEILSEARYKALGLEREINDEDDEDDIPGSTPIFARMTIFLDVISFELCRPMYTLSEQDLNRLLPLEST